MWIFNYFKKKKEEQARLLEENRRKKDENLRKEKLRYHERQLYIDDFVNKLNDAEHEKEMESVKLPAANILLPMKLQLVGKMDCWSIL